MLQRQQVGLAKFKQLVLHPALIALSAADVVGYYVTRARLDAAVPSAAEPAYAASGARDVPSQVPIASFTLPRRRKHTESASCPCVKIARFSPYSTTVFPLEIPDSSVSHSTDNSSLIAFFPRAITGGETSAARRRGGAASYRSCILRPSARRRRLMFDMSPTNRCSGTGSRLINVGTATI